MARRNDERRVPRPETPSRLHRLSTLLRYGARSIVAPGRFRHPFARGARSSNAQHSSSDNHAQRYWDRFIGVTGPEDPRLNEIAPIEHVAAAGGPVLLIHGRDDSVVPYEQSEVMEKALRKAGKPVELVTLKKEDHWLSRSATRLQMLEATVRFLEASNPP